MNELEEEDCCQKNPLFIEVILENLFNYFSSSELKLLRQVCYSWNFMSLRKLQQRLFHKNIIDLNSQEKLTRFTKVYEDYQENIIGYKFRFIPVIPVISGFNNNFFINSEDTLQFFEIFSYNIKSLEVRIDNDNFGDIIKKCSQKISELKIKFSLDSTGTPKELFIQEDQKGLPHLRSLSLSEFPREKVEALIPFIVNLIKNAPNLQTLSIESFSWDFSKCINSIFQIENLAKSLKNFKLIDLVDNSFENFSFLAREKRLELSSFSLHKGLNIESLNDFLESQSNSLEDLEIESYSNNGGLLLFPKMKKLKRLKMCAIASLSSDRLYYLSTFPNLKEFNLNINIDYRRRENQLPALYFNPSQTPFNNLMKLVINSIFFNEPESTLVNIAHIFPRLKSLQIVDFYRFYEFPENFFQVLWTLWTDTLEELIIEYYINPRFALLQRLNSEFTGLKDYQLERLYKLESLDKEFIDTTKNISILNMKKLKKLHMSIRNIPFMKVIFGYKLNDITGIMALARMENLTELILDERFHSFTNKCRKELGKTGRKLII